MQDRRPSTTQLGPRTSSLPRLGANGGQGLKAVPKLSKTAVGLTRVGTAPTGLQLPASRRSSNAGSGDHARADRLPIVEGLSDKLASRWGADSCDRHRLLVASQGVAGQDFVGTFGFKCDLCHGMHEVQPCSPKQKLEEICE